MNGKRIVSAALALLLTAGMPMAALAEEYDLANGNITVKADNSGQYVSQEGGVTNEKQTTETVIKQADNTADTGNTITVETSGGAKAELTIEDLQRQLRQHLRHRCEGLLRGRNHAEGRQ